MESEARACPREVRQGESGRFGGSDMAGEQGKKPARGAAKPDAEALKALEKRAAEARDIVDFVDRTSLAGDEESISGEITNADQHPADTSDITYQRELDLTVKNIAEARLAQVEEALERQREGTYGICEECG